MTTWVMFAILFNHFDNKTMGNFVYEFSTKEQCVSAIINLKKHTPEFIRTSGYCQEVKK
jgi:hypothetical protein